MKLLIVNLMQIGDLVLTTPIFHALKDKYPDLFLAAAVNAQFADLVKFNPYLNQLFEIDKHSLRNFCSDLKAIRACHFDLLINLNDSERASALAILSGAKRIVGYAKPPFTFFFNETVPNLKRSIHQVDSHFNVLSCAGFTNLVNFGLEIFTPPNLSIPIEIPSHSKLIALNIGASWSSKRWPFNFFAQLANDLIQRGFTIAFLGSRADLPLVNQCLNLIPSKENTLVCTGRFNLLQLAAFFDNCHLLITNDSGPMHIAAARNLPTVSIFGSSPVIGFAPLLHSHTLIKSPAPCHPCYKHSCPLQGDSYMRCMKSITPDIVLKYSLELLSTFGQPAKDLPRIQGAYDCKVIDLAKQK